MTNEATRGGETPNKRDLPGACRLFRSKKRSPMGPPAFALSLTEPLLKRGVWEKIRHAMTKLALHTSSHPWQNPCTVLLPATRQKPILLLVGRPVLSTMEGTVVHVQHAFNGNSSCSYGIWGLREKLQTTICNPLLRLWPRQWCRTTYLAFS